MVRRGWAQGFGEADETCAGGEEEGVRGRQTEEKAVLVVAAEQDGRGSGRIRLRRAPDVSSESRRGFIEESATPGPLVHADGWQELAAIANMKPATVKTVGYVRQDSDELLLILSDVAVHADSNTEGRPLVIPRSAVRKVTELGPKRRKADAAD